jgi:DNA-binding NtrC family response regulator
MSFQESSSMPSFNKDSGSGKELMAKIFQFNSTYKAGGFVGTIVGLSQKNSRKMSSLAMKKNAYTGADDFRIGKLEVANGGTFLFDEGGDNKKIHVDLTVISAIKTNLEEAVFQGKFREDFYYQLVVYSVFLFPLSQRQHDIPTLMNHCIEKNIKQQSQKGLRLSVFISIRYFSRLYLAG